VEKAFNFRDAKTDFTVDCRTGSGISVCGGKPPPRGVLGEFFSRKSRKAREFHARCVKISRIVPSRKFLQRFSLAFLHKNRLALALLGNFLALVLTTRSI
jgi:hypothetical protein